MTNLRLLELRADILGDYDIPLMIASKQFQNNGKLFSPVDERDSLWGDVNTGKVFSLAYSRISGLINILK